MSASNASVASRLPAVENLPSSRLVAPVLAGAWAPTVPLAGGPGACAAAGPGQARAAVTTASAASRQPPRRAGEPSAVAPGPVRGGSSGRGEDRGGQTGRAAWGRIMAGPARAAFL